VILLVQFRIALQVRQTIGMQFKIKTENLYLKCIQKYDWTLEIQLQSCISLIWFDLFVTI